MILICIRLLAWLKHWRMQYKDLKFIILQQKLYEYLPGKQGMWSGVSFSVVWWAHCPSSCWPTRVSWCRPWVPSSSSPAHSPAPLFGWPLLSESLHVSSCRERPLASWSVIKWKDLAYRLSIKNIWDAWKVIDTGIGPVSKWHAREQILSLSLPEL